MDCWLYKGMLTSYSEYQFEKMLNEMGPPGVGSVDATNAAVPMAPPVAPTPGGNATPGAKPGQANPQQQQQQLGQIKQVLTQAWGLISKTPAAKEVQPLFAQILNKVGFKVTGYTPQPGQTAPQAPKKSQPVTLKGLNPQVISHLTYHPNLTNAINMLGRYPDVAEPLSRMMSDNQHRFPEWEYQMASGKMTVNDLKQKLVTAGYYNPMSYPRY